MKARYLEEPFEQLVEIEDTEGNVTMEWVEGDNFGEYTIIDNKYLVFVSEVGMIALDKDEWRKPKRNNKKGEK